MRSRPAAHPWHPAKRGRNDSRGLVRARGGRSRVGSSPSSRANPRIRHQSGNKRALATGLIDRGQNQRNQDQSVSAQGTPNHPVCGFRRRSGFACVPNYRLVDSGIRLILRFSCGLRHRNFHGAGTCLGAGLGCHFSRKSQDSRGN